jgi:GTP cyclohydrolase I
VEIVEPELHPRAREERLLARRAARDDRGEALPGGVEDGERRPDRRLDPEAEIAELGELRLRQLVRDAKAGLGPGSDGLEIARFGESPQEPGEGRHPRRRNAQSNRDLLGGRATGEGAGEVQSMSDRQGMVGDVALHELAGFVEAIREELGRQLPEQGFGGPVAGRRTEGRDHRAGFYGFGRRAAEAALGSRPMPKGNERSDEERVERLAGHVRAIIDELGLDRSDPNLAETDRRVAKLYLEMFHGLSEGAEPKVTTFPNDERYSAMVMEKQIPFYSMCSHHFVPFYGHAHIAYVPNESFLGLSKFARILEFYAKRPQLQERLTEQIANFFEAKLKPQGVMVVIEARHLCVEMRGVKKPGAVTVTSAIRGIFHQKPVREEFLDLMRR